MKSSKHLVVGVFVLISFFIALPSLAESLPSTAVAEGALRAANENQQHLLQVIRELKDQKKSPSKSLKFLSSSVWRRPHCDDEDDRQTCVPKCNVRYSDGTCASYGSDFCGPDAKCVEKCSVRYSDGSCASYASDHCGPDASCTENCTVRYSNGTCASYGADVCY